MIGAVILVGDQGVGGLSPLAGGGASAPADMPLGLSAPRSLHPFSCLQ